MATFTHKTDVDLTFDANKRRIRTEANILLAALINEALEEMSTKFNKGLAKGNVLEIGGDRDEMRALLRRVAKKV